MRRDWWMITSLRGRIGSLILVFCGLVVIGVAATAWVSANRQRDAMIISLASRQHKLIKQMTDNAQELVQDRNDEQKHLMALQETADTFDQTLWVLTNGGQAPYLPNQPVDVPATLNPDILAGLHQVHHTWDIFRGYLNMILATPPGHPDSIAAIRAVERLSPKLMRESDGLVELYQAASMQKAYRLQWMEAAFLVSALGLLAAAFLVAQRFVINPLHLLASVAERISQGDLSTPIKITGPRELEAMAHSLDTMRIQVKSSQDKLLKRTQKLEVGVAQRRRELQAAVEISQDIVAELDLDQLLSSVTDRARTLTQAQLASLCLFTANGRDMVLVSTSGEHNSINSHRPTAETNQVAEVVGAGEAAAKSLPCANCDFLKKSGSGVGLATPLRVGERTLGALCVVRTAPEKFNLDETRALTLIANSAAVAIANAWLVESGRRHAEQATAMAEREYLAAELHDNLAQTLSLLNLKTDRLQELLASENKNLVVTREFSDIRTALCEAYDQVRTALVNLREPRVVVSNPPSESSAQAMAKELADCLADFRETSGLDGELTITELDALALPTKVQRQILHIIREALTNVRRHAQAQRAWVRVERVADGDQVRFTVEDDGCGFDPASVNDDTHLGLTIMVARAERSGGHLVVDAAPGVGTKIVASFPLNQV